MNSVMGIGDNIVLLKDGNLVWQGDKSEVLESEEDVLKDFIFASPFLRRLREDALKQRHAND